MTSAGLGTLDTSFVDALEGLFVPWQAAAFPDARLVVLNERLAGELGLDPEWLASPDGVGVLSGAVIPDGAVPVAMAYAGHQFGNYSPRLGDGRALLVAELVDGVGARRDLHLKGSGATPFSRGGDGKAALGPMLRELVISEAMAALGIPTTRSLAVLTTGEAVARDEMLPGAMLVRVAASHLRVGMFEYAARLPDETVLRRLVEYAIDRHYPEAREAERPALRLLECVVDAQARLIAQWMTVGFIHGVMNTDNMTISGETIDYGPCAFMDAYDPATVFSSIDHGGRYAFGNQPGIGQWNLARFAETLLSQIDADIDVAVKLATAVLEAYPQQYRDRWQELMAAKLGLGPVGQPGDDELVGAFVEVLASTRADFTSTFRRLAASLRTGEQVFSEKDEGWVARWRARVECGDRSLGEVADGMDLVNPLYIARNHLVEEALAAATAGDHGPLVTLLGALRRPFTEREGLDRYGEPAPEDFGRYQTFCGT